MPPRTKNGSPKKRKRVDDDVPSPSKRSPLQSPVSRGPSVFIPGAFITPTPNEPTPERVDHGPQPGPSVGPGPHRVKAQAKVERQRKRPRDENEPHMCEAARQKKVVCRELAPFAGDEDIDEEVQQMMTQLHALHVNSSYRKELFKCRETAQRAADMSEERARKVKERDQKVELFVKEEEIAIKEKERIAREREERRRQRERERVLAAKREAEARERERMMRWAEELAEKSRREERARRAREEREREEARRRAEADAAADREFQEKIRKARVLLATMDTTAIQNQLDLYDGKWAELKDGRDLPPLPIGILPWPILGYEVTRPADITLQRVRDFVFHPLRKGMEKKSRRDRVRADMLKWHPDKFNAKVLNKVVNAEQVAEAAGQVARFLTQIMEEETGS
ncbi:hypothetical protein HWV62_42988 [Athelia sp. TMB]|nr:hypothetical protein HWV62_42988 [Athelia sp. TMB]